jgi:hypothetical protein
MSIEDEIDDRCARHMLFPVIPQAPGAPIQRAMFVAEALWNILESPEGDEAWEKRVGELRADLERFVTGEPIDPSYLFLLYPFHDAVWEIRSVRPDPSIRVLGLFALRDVYIAANHALREDLGGWQDRTWKTVKRTAKAAWRWLFNTYAPLITRDVNHLVTGALNGKYFKDRS